MRKKIYLASDHAGFEHKKEIEKILEKNFSEYEVFDCGAESFDSQDDYPEFIQKACEEMKKDLENSLAIVLGGSGQGEAMVANRFEGIRATAFYGGSKEILKLSKKHNNANVLSLGARFIEKKDLEKIISIWLEEDFENEERHIRRIEKF